MPESALVRLARITRVESYKRRGDTGNSERVDSYLRKSRDLFGAGASTKTKKGINTTETAVTEQPVIQRKTSAVTPAKVAPPQPKTYNESSSKAPSAYTISPRAGKYTKAMVQAKVVQAGRTMRLYKPSVDGPKLKEKGMLLPPATWTNVLIAKDLDNPPGGKYLTGQAPNHAKDLATGTPGHWKWQDKRLKEKTAEAALEKWALLARLQKGFATLDRKIKGSKNTDPLDATIYFMRLTGVRPGEDKEKNELYDTVGALNFRAEHVKVNGSKVTLTFIPGKNKGRPITIERDDKDLAAHVTRWSKGKKPGDFLFQNPAGRFGNDELTARVRDLSGDDGMEARKFRTQLATATTLRAIQAWNETHTAPLTKAQFKKAAKDLVAEAQGMLGHSSWTMTYNNYVSPVVWGSMIADESWLA